MQTVTVVTPSLNQSNFIVHTINSVLNQNYPLLDYFVIDAGSKDCTVDILRTYNNRVKWISEPDNGQASAVNKGWQLTDSDIVAWLNADDSYRVDAILSVVKFLELHPDVDIVYGDCDYIGPEGQTIRAYPVKQFNYEKLVRFAFNYLPQPSTFIRRRVFEKGNYLDVSLDYVMDFDLWLQQGIYAKITYLPVKLANLRLHPAAKSVARSEEFAQELIMIYKKLFLRQDLPPSILKIRNISMSNVYYRASYCCYWSGNIDRARIYSLKALRYSPLNLHKQLLLAIFGEVGLKMMLPLKINRK